MWKMIHKKNAKSGFEPASKNGCIVFLLKIVTFLSEHETAHSRILAAIPDEHLLRIIMGALGSMSPYWFVDITGGTTK